MARWLVAIGLVLGCDPPEVMDLPRREVTAPPLVWPEMLVDQPITCTPIRLQLDDPSVVAHAPVDLHTPRVHPYEQEGISSVVVFGGEVYFSIYGHQIWPRGVFRAPRDGGPDQPIWTDHKVIRLEAYPDGMLATSKYAVAWIDARGTATVLYEASGIRAAVLVSNDLVVARFEGDAGVIERYSPAGDTTRLLTTRKEPDLLATRDDRLYFSISNALWSISLDREQGPVPICADAVANPMGGVFELWTGDRGLYWYTIDRAYVLPWPD